MMKITAFVLLAVTTAVIADDYFAKKFAYTQVMSKCIGEKSYYDWLSKVMTHKKECYHEPLKILHEHEAHIHTEVGSNLDELLKSNRPIFPLIFHQTEDSEHSPGLPFHIPLNFFANRQKRTALYDAPIMKHLMTKAMSKVSNFTCVLQKLDIVDANMNLKLDAMKGQLENLTPSPVLNQDLVKVVDHCHKLSMCLPHDIKSPMPFEIKRALAFMKCDKKLRMAVCMKKDIMKYLDLFDVSELPFKTDDEGEMAEKILHVLWGSEAKEAFEIY